MGIDHENYSNQKSEFIREFLLDLERHNLINKFIQTIKVEKPWVL
jgi:hypothetical protein